MLTGVIKMKNQRTTNHRDRCFDVKLAVDRAKHKKQDYSQQRNLKRNQEQE